MTFPLKKRSLTSRWLWPLLVLALLLGQASPARADSAYTYWLKLREALFFLDRPLSLPPGALKVTVGGEKEGGGSVITRILGPNQAAFEAYVARLNESERAAFLREFLDGMTKGRYVAQDVRDEDGRQQISDRTMLIGRNFRNAGLPELQAAFESWLAKAGDESFSFITPSARQRIFRGTLVPGTEIEPLAKQEHIEGQQVFEDWVPLYGDPQRYILGVETQVSNTGWEIKLAPMDDLIAYERMVKWFRESLEVNGELYPAPGHTRIVFKVGDGFDEDGLVEALRALQAYIVVRGMAGKMMLERSLTIDKAVHPDDILYELETERGVFRLEPERFGKGTLAIEFRVGSNSEAMRNLFLPLMISMISTNDFRHLKPNSWSFIDGDELENLKGGDLAKRFGVRVDEAASCLRRLRDARMVYNEDERIIHPNYWVPFWRWENAPFLGARKKALLKTLTRAFIESVARWKSPQYSDFQSAFQTWARASRLSSDLLAYLEPPRLKSGLADVRKALLFPSAAAQAGAVDPNSIDLGLERTARLPVSAQTLRDQVGGDPAWLGTLFDATPGERRDILRGTAAALARRLGAPQTPKLLADSLHQPDTSHGHGIALAYEIKDPAKRKWRVEWDGIGRSYDPDGEVIPDSVRGGHVEIVTPKAAPTAEELVAEDAAFDAQDLIPDPEFGGGHINVDLAPFSAKALARFLRIFHRHRGILALLFQDVSRLRSAEPVEVSPELERSLENFAGDDAELERLLYDERYFNMYVGRKTRYLQLDMGAYFQDVIPPELISADYDLAIEPWRPQFRANPDARKAEFRLFNSPRNALEAALQIRVVRALADVALDPAIPIDPIVQDVDYRAYLNSPTMAEADFATAMEQLRLDPKDYRPFLIEGLEATREYLMSDLGSAKLAQYLARPAPDSTLWGRATEPRPANQAIASAGKPNELPIPAQGQALADRRAAVNATAAELRERKAADLAPGSPDEGILVRNWERDCATKLKQKTKTLKPVGLGTGEVGDLWNTDILIVISNPWEQHADAA